MAKLGIRVRALVLVKVTDIMKKGLQQWLKEHSQVNSLARVNGEWDFMAEAVFTNIHSLEEFTEKLTKEFKGAQFSVQYIMEDLKREGFVPEVHNPQND